MTAVNFYSHGTQDINPTFLEVERYLSAQAVSIVVVIYNVGAHLWSLLLGSLSERCGDHVAAGPSAMGSLYWGHNDRDRGIVSCGLPCRRMGVIPVRLNELSTDFARGRFPRFVYRLSLCLRRSDPKQRVWNSPKAKKHLQVVSA